MAEDKQEAQPKPGGTPETPGTPAKPGAEAPPKAAAPAKPAAPAPQPWGGELVESLRAGFPEVSFEALAYLRQNFLTLPRESVLPFTMYLKSECGFDMLTDLTAVDYPK